MPARRAASAIIDRLEAQHPDAWTELQFSTPFELLVATILSAQCTDARVNQVTPLVFARYPDARALAHAAPAELEGIIQPTGFFRAKTRSLLGMAQAVVKEHGGEVPREMDALVALPGVGRKTANVVRGHAFGLPGLPVDRHVLRVANRLGLATSENPEVVEATLGKQLPQARWTRASDTLILHGRRICKPKPLCDRCQVRAQCRYFAALGPESPQKEIHVTRDEFRALVDEALLTIPDEFRDAMKNIVIVVEDAPSARALAEVGLEPPDTLLGLYEGIPLTERQWAHGNVLPDKITLFQASIEESSEDREDTIVAIGETLIHEVGHYFGLSEEEIEEIEDKYWHSEATEEGPEERSGEAEDTEDEEQ